MTSFLFAAAIYCCLTGLFVSLFLLRIGRLLCQTEAQVDRWRALRQSPWAYTVLVTMVWPSILLVFWRAAGAEVSEMEEGKP